MARRPPRTRRLGLQARVALFYALGALLFSSALAGTAFVVTRNRLVDSAAERARDQVEANAGRIRNGLEDLPPPDQREAVAEGELDTVELTLDGTFRPNRTRSLLVFEGESRSIGGVEADAVPQPLRIVVQDGSAGQIITTNADGQSLLAIGVFIAAIDAEYYELARLDELDDTLATLRNILAGSAIGTAGLGAALGAWSARRLLRPIGNVSRTAQRIAAGDLSERLDPAVDPDLARLATSFNSMVATLAERLERDSRFASDVSHELRSPLMTLTASIEVLERRQDQLPEVAGQAVELLGTDIRRFQRLVEDLLEISRADAGAASLELSPLLLSEFLEQVVATTAAPGVEISHPADADDLIISADKRRLAQIISNLVDNADKYGGGATDVGYEGRGDVVRLWVGDRGAGVPLADRARIFDRFSRAGGEAGRRATATGSGLGLSLVAEHVRLHEGRVWVDDRPDTEDGAWFVVEIPVGDVESDGEFA